MTDGPAPGAPDGFRWGVTASSVSADGGAPAADWASWENDGRVPRSGDGAGFSSDHVADLALAATLGFTDVRITVEWARLEPRPGSVDTDTADHYRAVLTAAVAAGLRPWVTLHHTTLPGWFADDERGFVDAGSRGRFWARHVDRSAEMFDDLAHGWVPIEDPVGWALRGHLLGSRPPGRRDPEATRAAVEGAVEATFEAWRLLRSGRQPVLAVLGLPTVFTHRPSDDDPGGPDAHRAEARLWDRVLWDTWTAALADGALSLPWNARQARPEWAGAFDLIGVAHEHPVAVDRHGAFHPYPADGRTDGSGFSPVPDELGEALRRLHDALPDRELIVASTGLATDDDDWRDEIVDRTVDQVMAAIDDGLPVTGWFHDSLLDGYEWTRGFATPRGLVTRQRALKQSGRHLSERITGRPPPASLS